MKKLELHPIRTVLAHWRDLVKYGWEMLKAIFQFFKTLSLFLTLPLWYPILAVVLVITYPSYLRKVQQAKEEQINRLWGKVQ